MHCQIKIKEALGNTQINHFQKLIPLKRRSLYQAGNVSDIGSRDSQFDIDKS